MYFLAVCVCVLFFYYAERKKNMATDVIESLGIELTSNATKANKAIDSLNSRLTSLITNLSKVNTQNTSTSMLTLSKQTNNTSNATNSSTTSFNLLGKSLTSSNLKTKSLASAFGNLYANIHWIIRGVKQLGTAIESSMDYVETYNYFNVTMDKIGKEWSKDYKQWGYDTAETYEESFQDRIEALNKKMTGYELGEQGEATYTGAKNLGLDIEAMMNYQASIGAVTNSLGLMGEVSVNTQKAMSMLAADLSSFKNIDLKSVMTNLQSGLIGQSRALTYIAHKRSNTFKETSLISGNSYKNKTIRSEALNITFKERSTTIEMVA